MSELSHIDTHGKASMVDVGNKPAQLRIAKAKGFIRLQKETIKKIHENTIKKGDVLAISEFAGIQAAKQTGNLIPLCHPLLLTHISVSANLMDEGVEICSEVKCVGQTGVEMEALTAVTVGLLSIYDMCKAVDKQMQIEQVVLIEKTKTEI